MQDVLRHRYMMIKPAWKHPLVYYSFKFYNVTSFSLSRALKAKTYEKSHNLWTIGDIYESSLQVVNLHLTHKYNTSCHELILRPLMLIPRSWGLAALVEAFL